MTDINKTLMEKAQGCNRLDPDQQRKFLETFEERVVACCSIDEANSQPVKNHFKDMLAALQADYSDLTVKISPQVETSYQVAYLKTAKELDCKASIVSADCQSSPFGLIIHSDQPVQTEEKELTKRFANLLNPQTSDSSGKTKTSFWKKLFH